MQQDILINWSPQETRVAIIRSKLEERGSHLGDDVIELIGRKMKKSVRELEGILTKLLF